MNYFHFIKALMLIMASPLLAQAHLVTGTVTGPDGLMAGLEIEIHPSGQSGISTVTDESGNYSVDISSDFIEWFFPLPSEESGLLGEPISGVNVSGGKVVHLFVGNKVTISGDVLLPDDFPGDIEFDAMRLDKERSTGGWDVSLDENLHFVANLVAGTYVFRVIPACTHSDILNGYTCPFKEYFSWVTVDATQGSVSNVVIPVQDPLAPIIPNTPPDASKIQVGPVDNGGIAMISGSAGAIAYPSQIKIINLQTGHYTRGASLSDGSFEIPFLAPPGSYLEIRHDPTLLSWGGSTGAGTIIQIPPPGTPASSFATINRAFQWGGSIEGNFIENIGVEDSGQVWISGDLPNRDWKPGDTVNLSGILKVYSKNAASIDIPSLYPHGEIFLERVFDASGVQERANPVFMSSLLTPTGLPIERRGQNWNRGSTYAVHVGELNINPLTHSGPNSLDGTWQATLQVPNDLPQGTYSLVFEPFVGDIQTQDLHYSGVYPQVFDTIFSLGGTILVKVGSPQTGKLSWVLGLNDFSNGSRGTVALQDKNRLGIAGRVTTNSTNFILPREDARSGNPVTYRLEPFVPLIGASNRGWVAPPTVSFEFPSGNLHVSVKQPDGSVVDLGQAPFKQSYVQEPASVSGQGTDAGNHPLQYFALTTLGTQFDFNFTQYGRHLVTMEGSIDDIWGTSYAGGGTYEVLVARRLDLETGVFANTPFEVGDVFSPTVIVQPGVESDIRIEITLYPDSDPDQKISKVIEGTSNPYGYFHPKTGDGFVFSEAGEYRVDIKASHQDDGGILWMGAETWASVVESPGSPLIAHGQRNFDCNSNTRQQWMVANESNICGTHLTFPYHTGDIAWMMDTDVDPYFTAMVPAMNLQDTVGDFADLIRVRNAAHSNWYWDLEENISRGEIPLLSTTPNGMPAALKPDKPDTHFGYFYSGAARPGIRVRDMVSEAENQESYWRFDHYYYDQNGTGKNGDQINDYKFQFGGSVYRAPDLDFYNYAAYGSLWVLLPDDDPTGTRVMPPFQGNAGGPSGGPIMTLKGQDIDMFFHTTGTRAGSILEIGDFASFAGQIGPTLPSRVSITVTSPSDQVTQINGQANKVGYFYDSSTDLHVMEQGIWRVNVTIWHDGPTSAGPTQLPFPSGDVLGSNAGEFRFYVVERGSLPLAIEQPGAVWVQPGKGVVPLTTIAPDGWSDVQLHYTTVMPGFILEQGSTTSLVYNYDAPSLNADFPNLDLEDFDGFTGVDTITMSFLLSGTLDDKPVYRARQVLLQGEELMFPPQAQSNTIFKGGFE